MLNFSVIFSTILNFWIIRMLIRLPFKHYIMVLVLFIDNSNDFIIICRIYSNQSRQHDFYISSHIGSHLEFFKIQKCFQMSIWLILRTMNRFWFVQEPCAWLKCNRFFFVIPWKMNKNPLWWPYWQPFWSFLTVKISQDHHFDIR